MKKLKLFLNLVIVSFIIISCSSLKPDRKLASDEVKMRATYATFIEINLEK